MNLTIRTYLKVCINLCITIVMLLLCVFVLPKIVWFFMPFIVGWAIAFMASPLVRFLEVRLRLKRKAGSAFVIVAVLGLVVLGLYIVFDFAIRQIIGFAAYVPDMLSGIEVEVTALIGKLEIILGKFLNGPGKRISFKLTDLGGYVAEFFSTSNAASVDAIGNFAKQIPNVVVCVVVSLLSSYFFITDKSSLAETYEKYCPKMVKYRLDLIYISFKKAVGGYFKAQLRIEVWVYILMVIGFLILGIPYGWLIAIGIAFLDFLPIFGTGTVMVPWAVIKLFDRDYKMAIGLLITWGVGQLVRQIIQPKIVGDSVGLPALPTLLLIYLGYEFGGVGGMIIAMPVGIIFVRLYEEGMFDTTMKSLRILFAGINHFRTIRDEDMLVVHDYQRDVDETMKKMQKDQAAKSE